MRWRTHLLCLERVIGSLDGHVLLAADLDAVGDHGLGLALVGEGGSDGAHLFGGELVLSATVFLPCALVLGYMLCLSAMLVRDIRRSRGTRPRLSGRWHRR